MVGLRQVDGMPHSTRRGDETGGGAWAAAGHGDMGPIHTEEVTGSIPVSPTSTGRRPGGIGYARFKERGSGCAISSTSQRAVTPSAGGKLTETRGGKVDTLPPAEAVIGLRQVDEMALRPRRERSISGAHHPPEPSARWHQTTRTSSSGGTGRHGSIVEIPSCPP